jgi:hypothetical protein
VWGLANQSVYGNFLKQRTPSVLAGRKALRLSNSGYLKYHSLEFWNTQPQCLHGNLSPQVDLKRDRVGQDSPRVPNMSPRSSRKVQRLVVLPNPTIITPLNKFDLKRKH